MTNSNESPIIQIKNLGTKFGSDWVHKNLDLDVYGNRIISIIGDSGCGKTTLVREILLLQEITEGEIHLIFNQAKVVKTDGTFLIFSGTLKGRWSN